MIVKISGILCRERPLAALKHIVNQIFDRTRGRFSAWSFGWGNSYLGKNARIVGSKFITIGVNSKIQRNAWIEAVSSIQQEKIPAIEIGDYFYASDNLHIAASNRVKIGCNCLFGSNVYITDHGHGAYKGFSQSNPSQRPIDRTLVSLGSLEIGNNVWVGNNVVVMGSLKIGSGVVIGANAVVMQDVPENSIVVGVPAKIIKQFDSYKGEWVKVSR